MLTHLCDTLRADPLGALAMLCAAAMAAIFLIQQFS